MASNNILHVLIAFTLLCSISTAFSSNALETSPIPPPEFETDSDDSPSTGSPYTYPPTDLSPTPASIPSLDSSPAPAPAPEVAAAGHVESNQPTNSSSRRIKGGKKAGIAIGVVASACVVGLGGILCKKRKQNVQQSQLLGYPAREDLL